MLDLEVLIARLRQGGTLTLPELLWVCGQVKDIVAEESNVQQVDAPVTVVGDIHGQFYDLIELFRVGGWPPDTNYLFLGDYVDRGYYSVETISLLLCYKLRYPRRMTLLRGNHETRSTSMVYGFYSECIYKYGTASVWSALMEVFDCMTISAVVDNQVFAVHGGVSPNVLSLDHIRIINRFGEVPRDGPFSDMMWSDPDPGVEGFAVSMRGAGYTFGEDILLRFLHANRLSCMVRAHQLCADGFHILFRGRCATVWSAPNYCYRCRNKAALLEVDDDLLIGSEGQLEPRHFNVFVEAPEFARRRPANAPLPLTDDEDEPD